MRTAEVDAPSDHTTTTETERKDSTVYARLRKSLEESKDGGFTLVELLIVIVILAVLAAIVVFSVTGINNTSKSSACKTDVKAIDAAAEAYYAQVGSGAATIGALVSGGYLHADNNFKTTSGTSVAVGTGPDYTITFTPGGSGAGNAGGADTTTCP